MSRAMIAAAILAATLAPLPVSAARDRTPPCRFDEAVGVRCVWDARHMGNGEGRSFIAHRDQTVTYIKHRRARRLAVTNR